MVLSSKEWLDKMNEIIAAIQNNGCDSQVIMDMLSNMWISSVTYNVGDYVLYNNNIWKCLVKNSNITPTEGSTWTSVKITNEISTLNSNLTDTGWLKTTEVNGNYAYYRKKNGVVYITRGLNSNLTANTDVIIGTLPTGFRPLYPISNNISTTTETMVIQIQTDGSIKYNSSLSNYITPYIISFPV